jgi:hypothetical protein
VKRLAIIFGFVVVLMSHVFASEQSVLARVTVYWNSGGSGQHACWNGVRLRPGHCAVDPKKISYGSKVIFPDATCVAVDTGPDVVTTEKHSKPDAALASAEGPPTVVASTNVPPQLVAPQDVATVGAQCDLRTAFIGPGVSTALTWPRSARRRT